MKEGIRLQEAEYEHFKAAKGEQFIVRIGTKAAKAELVEVSNHGTATMPGATREPFSLLFRLDRGVASEAGVYRLEHERYGAMELLMTPVVPDPEGSFFEVVFG